MNVSEHVQSWGRHEPSYVLPESLQGCFLWNRAQTFAQTFVPEVWFKFQRALFFVLGHFVVSVLRIKPRALYLEGKYNITLFLGKVPGLVIREAQAIH